jgi:hypothetical protein
MIIMILLAGCHPSTHFMLPPNTILMINDEYNTVESKNRN